MNMKVLTISDSPTLMSGLGRVHRNIIDGLMAAGCQVFPCGWFLYDAETLHKISKKEIAPPPVFYEGPNGKARILGVPKRNGMHSMYAVWDALQLFKPDVVVTCGDYWDMYYMQACKTKCDFSFKWVAYLTIEHEDIGPRWQSLLKYADVLSAPSDFGRAVLESTCNNKEVVMIPYGTDATFERFPEERRLALRQERKCQDKLRFITVAQNTVRKNIPALMQAVELLAHRDPNREMQFYIHTNMDPDPQEAFIFDLYTIAERLGVSDWFSFPEGKSVSLFKAPADSVLADEYNASDFFISASMCEGYGLPMVEAMACGCPVIANATSTIPEHLGASLDAKFGWAPRGYLVSNKVEIHPPSRMVKVVRPEALAQAIWDAYLASKERPHDLEKMRQKCIEYAKGRTWQDMKESMSDVVKSVHGPIQIPVEVL